jgi:hypothetical protein
MQPRLTIRSATADDEAAIAALWQACGLVTSYNDPAKDFRFARDKSNSDAPLTPTMLIRLTPKPTRCSFTCGSAGHASARKRHSRTRQYQITHFKQITNDKDAQRKDVVGWFE